MTLRSSIVIRMESLFNNLPPVTGLVLLIGAPGSGKSTFATQLVAHQHLAEGVYISNDAIAKEMFGVTTDRGDKDGAIFAEQDRRIAAQLEVGKVAIVDATNVRPEARERLIAIAVKHHQPVTAFCFRRDQATLLRQNQQRDVQVPESMVIEYAELMHNVTDEKLHAEGVSTIIEVLPS